MPKKTSPSPNDQRSNTKNPNNPAYPADRANRVRQDRPKVAPPPPARHAKPSPKR